jgi:hypothetical protein
MIAPQGEPSANFFRKLIAGLSFAISGCEYKNHSLELETFGRRNRHFSS